MTAVNKDARIDLYTSVVPSKVQKSIQRDNFNAFIHYGLNTFANKEWSDGTLPPEIFDPSEQDTEQWVKVLKYAGAKGIIFTAKHHDGFCMWQTKTTEYSIKNSPYKNGKGDVVRELADNCKKHGMKFGIYLSPWDRNSEYYGTDKYDDFYCAQLTELLTGYGEIFCVWLDGACGAAADGKEPQAYDFERYYALIRKLSPNTVISNCGPDVRWVGNEAGCARESEWNVIPRMNVGAQVIMAASQQSEGQNMRRPVDILGEDLGSREFLKDYDEFVWSPAEVDVSIRPGWFYHKSQDWLVRSVNNLMYIYYTSVGGNSLLLLNVPPDTTGRINDVDVDKLVKLGDRIRSAFAKPVDVIAIDAPPHEGSNKIRNVLVNSYNKNSYDANSFYTPAEEADRYEIVMRFKEATRIDKVRLVENVAFSQRVEKYSIYAAHKSGEAKVYDGTTIGFNRIALFRKPVKTDLLRIVIESCREKPYIEQITAYASDGRIPRAPFKVALTRFMRRVKSVINKK